MTQIFEDGNESRRKLIAQALGEATPVQILRAREVINSKKSETLGFWILRDIAYNALALFDKGEYGHPKVCYFFAKWNKEFDQAMS